MPYQIELQKITHPHYFEYHLPLQHGFLEETIAHCKQLLNDDQWQVLADLGVTHSLADENNLIYAYLIKNLPTTPSLLMQWFGDASEYEEIVRATPQLCHWD